MSNRGFTLIELIMVIVILGILSAIAIPKYIDLQSEARIATADGVLGAAGSACAINYAAVQTKATPPPAIVDCSLLNNAILSSGLTITAGAAGVCSFIIDGATFDMAFAPETNSATCSVAKVIAAWPK